MITLKIIASLCIGFLCLCCCFLSPNPWPPHNFLLRNSTSFTDTTAASHPLLLFLSSSNAWARWHVTGSLWSCPCSEVELSSRTLSYTLYFFDGHPRSYITNDVWSMFVYFCTDILENKEIIYLFTYACFRRTAILFCFLLFWKSLT